MRVNVVRRMLLQDFHGAPLVSRKACPHPQQETTVVELLLQVVRMMLAQQHCKGGTDQTARAPGSSRADRSSLRYAAIRR